MSEKADLLPGTLTVILRDDAPVYHFGASPAYRSVCVPLTADQAHALRLRWTGSSGGADHYESIDRCIISMPGEG